MIGSRTIKRVSAWAIGWALEPERMKRAKRERELEEVMGFDGQFRAHRDFEFALLRRMGLRPSHRVLDVGCGPLTLGVPLIGYLDRGRYTGIDIRSHALSEAYREVADHALAGNNPRLVCSESFGVEELGDASFDVVTAFSMLYHLDDRLVRQFFATLPERLGPESLFVANINDLVESSRWLEFPFMQRDIAFYQALADEHGLELIELGAGRSIGYAHDDSMATNVFMVVRHRRAEDAGEWSGLRFRHLGA